MCAALAAGCASQGDRQDVSETAARFLRAAEAGDPGAACALLTPRTRTELAASDGPCAETLPTGRLGGEVTGADTWSGWARVDTEDSSLFLTRFDSGWLVAAAGCVPDGSAPYRCVVGG